MTLLLSAKEGLNMESTSTNQKMKIYFNLTKTVGMEVESFDTIEDVKDKFSSMEGVPSDKQELFFNGTHLKNEKNKLVDYGVSNGCTVDMFLQMEIHIKASWSGKIITLSVNSWDTVYQCKEKIQVEDGILASKQIIVYGGKQLEDCHTLAAYKIQPGSTLYAISFREDIIKIFVSTGATGMIELEVERCYTVENVKKMIELMVCIPRDEQRLEFAGKQLKNGRTLSCYNIQKESIIHVLQCMRIRVQRPSGKRFLLEMPKSSTIDDVKLMIHKKDNVPPVCQTLLFKGIQLLDGRTLTNYNIQNGSILQLLIPRTQIFVKSLEGKTISLEVLMCETIDNVKAMIRDKQGISPARQKLSYGWKELKSGCTLADYNIQKDCTISLHLKIGSHGT